MGINKLPEAGNRQFLSRPQDKKTKPLPGGRQPGADSTSVRKTSQKHSSSSGSKVVKKSNITDYDVIATSTRATTSDDSPMYPGIHWKSKDILTGEIFNVLAKNSFEKERPYCFAVAISTNERTSKKKKIFMDGSKFLRLVEAEDLKVPGRTVLGINGEVEILHEIDFFAARDCNRVEKISSFSEAVHGPNNVILGCFVRSEDSNTLESVGDTTNVIMATAYFLGIGVEKDEEYAKKIMSKMDKEDRLKFVSREVVY